jgi:hypothetical protein
MSDSESDEGAYDSYDVATGNDDGDAEKPQQGKINADLRMDKLPEAPKSLQPAGPAQNTGPKGVKADFELAKRNQAGINFREKLQRERALEAKAKGQVNLNLESNDKKDQKDTDKTEKAKSKKHHEDEEEDNDDEEFQKYKLKMMQAIQTVQNSLPVFGEFTRVSSEEYMETVKSVHELTYVVAHVYENHVADCSKLNVCFEELAPQFDHVRFIRVKSTELFKNYSEAGLPTLLICKGGKMIHSFTRVTTNFTKACKTKEVAQFLAGLKVLKMPDGYARVDDKKKDSTTTPAT